MTSSLDVRPGERGPAAAMTLAVALVLLAYYFLKPARDSLFLAQASPAQLPLAFVVSALVAAPVAGLHARLARRWPLPRVTALTLALLAATLPPLRLLLETDLPGVPYLLYAWAGLVGALATSQLWLLAGSLFDASQAKRLFPLLGVGSILGAMAGGEATRWLIQGAGLEAADLLQAAAATLLLDALLVAAIGRRWSQAEPVSPRRRVTRDSGGARGWRTLFRSRLLTLIVGMLALEVMAASFVDYQFKVTAWERLSGPESLAAFLGRFYSVVSLISLVLQLGFAGRLVRWFGVGGLLGGLPAVLLCGAGAMLVSPGLAAAAFLRGGDLGLKHSLERTGREMLFVPVPPELRKRSKLFIDLFVDRWFRGLAGLLLLGLTAGLGVPVRWLSLVVLALAAAWLLLVARSRAAYADAFRDALARREIDPAAVTRQIDDPQARRSLLDALAHGGERAVLYALRLAPALKDADAAGAVRPLLDRPQPGVRAAAYTALAELGDAGMTERARTALAERDPDVRRAACRYLTTVLPTSERRELFRALLRDAPLQARGEAALWIARRGEGADLDLLEEGTLDALAAAPDPGARRAAAVVLGRRADEGGSVLARLLDDPAPEVAGAALEALARRDPDQAPAAVLAALEDRRLRASARRALERRGAPAVAPLQAFASGIGGGVLARLQTVRALAAMPQREALEALAALLEAPSPAVRDAALAALVRARLDGRAVRLPPDRLDDLHKRCLAQYYGLFQARHRLGRRAWRGRGGALLLRTLDEQTARVRANAFRLLALRFAPRGVLDAWAALDGTQRHLRAGAAEYLDATLTEPCRSRQRPLYQDLPDVEVWEEARRCCGVALRNDADALTHLLRLDDAWVRACAAFAARGEPELAALARQVADDLAPLVREAAAERNDDVLTVVEKVILLQDVDVFAEVPGEQLAVLASIAEEERHLAGDVLYREGETADALYLVLDGRVTMTQNGRAITEAGPGEAFGTWALFDEEPRLATAAAAADVTVLRVDRDDFTDILADHVEVAQGVLRTVARRLRGLAARAS